jgi:NTE family protein
MAKMESTHAGAPAELSSPVEYLAGEKPGSELREGVGICVSGGGYRAMLYHLGAYWRLCELGILGGAVRISSVSGGSIVSAKLGLEWKHLGLAPGMAPGPVPQAFRDRVVEPLRKMASTSIDFWPTILSAACLANAGRMIAARYDAHLFHGATLQDLPDDSLAPGAAGAGPRFVINATNLRSGVLWRFSRNYMADYTVGVVARPKVALSVAVASSSAFPPLLSPVKLPLAGMVFEPDKDGAPVNAHTRDLAVLTDGGVYDNLGMETVWKRCRTVFVSDAGGGADFWDPRAARNWVRQIWRVFWVQRQQVGGLRRRQLMASYTPRAAPGDRADPWWRHGSFWSIATPGARYGVPDWAQMPEAWTKELANVAVRLTAMPARVQEGLINWGYSSCDASVRRWYDPALPRPGSLPYPNA